MERTISRMVLAIVLAAAAAAGPALAASEPGREEAAYRELQRLAAARPAYTTAVGKRVVENLMVIWGHPDYRHRVAFLLNMNGGHLDALMNRSFLDDEPAATRSLPNFATVVPGLYRGGQPDASGFERLAKLGVQVVVNLRYEDNTEEPLVRSRGMEPVWLPIPDTGIPSSEQLSRFLELVRDRGRRPVYFHCAAGVNRTGLMCAIFRIERGWGPERAMREMRRYGFDASLLNCDLQIAYMRSYRRSGHPR